MIQKRIGKVEIYEILDNRDTESTLKNGADKRNVYSGQASALLMNFARARTIDNRSLDSLLNIFWHPTKKTGILLQPNQKYLNLSAARNKDIEIFMGYEECIRSWGNDFSEESNCDAEEKRFFARIPVALPVQLGLLINGRNHKDCFAVATNLSPAGLYARFIDSYSEVEFKKLLKRSFSTLVDIELELEPGLTLSLSGNLAHQRSDGHGVGIEFWDIKRETQRTLFKWLYDFEAKNKEKQS